MYAPVFSKMSKSKGSNNNNNKNDKYKPVVPYSSEGFWLKRNWYLSSAIRLRAGGMMVTEGAYRSQSSSDFYSQPPKVSNFILVFSKLDQQLANPAQQNSPDARLPNGLAIRVDQWSDLKKAFARYYMYRESKSQQEINLMFGFDSSDFSNDRPIQDITQWNKESLQRDPALVAYSKQRASVMAKALKQIPAHGMEDNLDDDNDEDEDSDCVACEADDDEAEEEEEAVDEEESDADEKKTEAGSDFEQEEEEKKATVQQKKVAAEKEMPKKATKKKLTEKKTKSEEDVVVVSSGSYAAAAAKVPVSRRLSLSA
jgi:hypothetical protein